MLAQTHKFNTASCSYHSSSLTLARRLAARAQAHSAGVMATHWLPTPCDMTTTAHSGANFALGSAAPPVRHKQRSNTAACSALVRNAAGVTSIVASAQHAVHRGTVQDQCLAMACRSAWDMYSAVYDTETG
jgi:hypothetical protein